MTKPTLKVALTLSLLYLSYATTQAGFDLKGKVTDVDGKGIANVTVKIATARPRVGRGVL